MIDALSLAFEREELRVLPDEVLLGELLAFQAERLPSGLMRYSAPEGMHDDCLVAGTLIRTRHGLVPVERVLVGDEVLTHTGQYRRVLRLGQRYAETVYEVSIVGRPALRLTGNHRLLVHERTRDFAGRTNTLQHRAPHWACVDDGVSLTDSAATSPVPRQTLDVEAVSLLDYAPDRYRELGGLLVATTYSGRRINPKQNRLPARLPVDEDFCRLMGYYFAEGSTGRHNVGFASHEREAPIRAWLVAYLTRLGLRPWHRQTSAHGWAVSVGSMPLSGFFRQFGTRADKAFPTWVTELPAAKQWAVLVGYLLGDGSFAAGDIRANTISVSGAYQLYELALRLGLPVSLRPRPGQYGHRPQWELRFGRPAARAILRHIPASLLAGKLVAATKEGKDQTQLRFADGRLLGAITAVTPVAHNGQVYNLEVDQDHSYVANGTAVHNCVIALALAWHGASTEPTRFF